MKQFFYFLFFINLTSLLGITISEQATLSEKDPIDFVTIECTSNTANHYNKECDSIDYDYQMSMYEVTALQYRNFLNAVACKADPHHLYDPRMSSDPTVASIIRSEKEGLYSYNVIPGRANVPITYVSFYNALRFCNWLENGSPTSDESDAAIAASTENGAYFLLLKGDQEIAERNFDAHYYLPSESEWNKAAYHKKDPLDSSHSLYPTQHNTPPNNGFGDPTNQANYKAAGNIPSSQNNNFKLVSVDQFDASQRNYHVRDMGGNVAEWTSSLDLEGNNIIRGGSWQSDPFYNNDLLATSKLKSSDPSKGTNFIGFRIAATVEKNRNNSDIKSEKNLMTKGNSKLTNTPQKVNTPTSHSWSSWFSNLSIPEKVGLTIAGVALLALTTIGIIIFFPEILGASTEAIAPQVFNENLINEVAKESFRPILEALDDAPWK